MMAKERLIALIELMPEDEIKKLLNEINKRYILKEKTTWDDIDEETPDEIDLEMIRAIKRDNNEHSTFFDYEEINW